MKPSLVLIHGWGTSGYNSNLSGTQNYWEDRQELISYLKKDFNLFYFCLPGFYGVPEPDSESFDMDNFVDYLNHWLKQQKISPDYLLGYSFGGALALNHKVKTKSKAKLILISPALMRAYSGKSIFASRIKKLFPIFANQKLKAIYQSLFSKYYRQGSSFLRQSYDSIVRLDSRPLLKSVNQNEIILIYGQNDTSTPPQLVESYSLHKVHVIPGGGHEIGSTHPPNIFNLISHFESGN